MKLKTQKMNQKRLKLNISGKKKIFKLSQKLRLNSQILKTNSWTTMTLWNP